MKIKDEIARRKLELMREDFEKGVDYTEPWLDLDIKAFRTYREGTHHFLPDPFCDNPVDVIMMKGVQGQEILCLAGGGGQHSAVFSMLGAVVTVLDLTPEQLDGDQRAARHYGYEITTIQGDMRDLSIFPDAAFDRIYQPISTLFIPDLSEVYRGVARVLKPGGFYFSDYAVPLLYMAENRGWDGKGYSLYITEPYVRGAILEDESDRLNFNKGKSFSEFHHLLSDIINGMVTNGLEIFRVWENPRPNSDPPLTALEPGSTEHQHRFLPFGLSVIAEKKDL